MKKIFTIIFIFAAMLICVQPVIANARWQNPNSIRTYIEPNNKKELMKQAFAKWSQATNNKIVFKYVSSPDDAQITVKFVKDAEKATNMKNALGVTYPHHVNGIMVSADIKIADNAPGGALLKKDAVYRVMVHEIGHAIGILEHSPDPLSVMYYAKASRSQDISSADLKVLNKLYGW